jgi:hypothetical protein
MERGVARSLHRDVWESVHGPIPEGHHVHHKNNDWDRNDIDDLECLSSSDHRRLHAGTSTEPLIADPLSPGGAIADAEPPDNGFRWSDEEMVVVQHQPALAVYINPFNQIVLRTHGGYDDDAFIIISAEHLPKVIAKLHELHELLKEPGP